ncbi:MAG: hypothetical protein ACRDDY_18750 [Clostridium sp.]|uniref:hypothetical protein n=1 Tax=Clostridium sp. TaxID=1506 RepID=UPI003EE807C0
MNLKKFISLGLLASIVIPGTIAFAKTSDAKTLDLGNGVVVHGTIKLVNASTKVAEATTKIVSPTGGSTVKPGAGLQYYDGNNDYFYLGGVYGSSNSSTARLSRSHKNARGFDSLHTSSKGGSKLLHITL